VQNLRKEKLKGFCAFWFCIEISKGHNDLLFVSLPQSVFQDWVWLCLHQSNFTELTENPNWFDFNGFHLHLNDS